jgi:hypothetical protein
MMGMKKILALAGLVVLLAAALWGSTLYSQPVRDRILDVIDVEHTMDGTVIRIGMTIPVRYIRHYPYESGNELRIKVLPFDVRTSDRDALHKRESLVPFNDDPPELVEVVYEGDVDGGPFLTLLFDHEVHYEVEQGRDSRSIVVHLLPVTPQEEPATDAGRTGQ